MKLVGILPVRSEEWVIGLTLRAMLLWMDEVIVLLHACMDRSEEIVMDLARENNPRITVVGDEDPTWDEMRHRQALLEIARASHATHVALLDADEALSANLLPTIRETIEQIPPGHILQLPGYNLRGSLHRYHANGVWGNRWFSTAFKDDGKAGWQGDGFHHREPFSFSNIPFRPISQGYGGILHLWGASEKRLHERHRYYRIAERLRWPQKSVAQIEAIYSLAEHGSATNRSFGTPATWTYADVPESWWVAYAPLMQHLDLEQAPWQEEYCDRLIAEHGAEKFRGLTV